jgi:NADH-quinone oxidoreductase subunit L
MRAVLVALAVLAAAGGVLGLSATTGALPRFLEPVLPVHEGGEGLSVVALSLISLAVAVAGIGVAWVVYGSGRVDWVALRTRFAGAKRALQRGLYVDDLYGGAVVRPARVGSAFAAFVVDLRVVDGAVNGVGALFAAAARAGRRVQTGMVRNYALAFLLGVVGILSYVAVRS